MNALLPWARAARCLAGVAVPIVAALAVAWFVSPTDLIGRGERLVLIVVLFGVGVLGAALLGSPWAIPTVPAAYFGTLWLARTVACSGCTPLAAGFSVPGAIGYGLAGLAPMFLGSAGYLLSATRRDRR